MKEINKIEKELIKINNQYKYTWEKEGKKILLDENKIKLTEKERKILEILLIQEVPNDLHRNLWLICSGARLLQKENNGNYSKLLKFSEELENKNHYFYKYLTKKISHDLYRSDLKEEEIYKLKNILNAFNVRNLSINYCQGLNIIVSYLLKMTNYNEEESYYLFIKLMEDILPFDFFFFAIGIETEINLIKKLIEIFDKELYEHLNTLNSFCFLDSKISMWIISLMLFKTDIRISNFFFDCVFFFCVNNDNFISVLYKMIFSILEILRNELLECQQSSKISEILDKFINNPISEENYKKLIYYNLIKKNKINFCDKKVFEVRKREIKKVMNQKKMDYKFEENIEEVKCNKYFPLCIKEKEEKPVEDFVVYKSGNNQSLYIIDNYYKIENNENNNKNEILVNNNNNDKNNIIYNNENQENIIEDNENDFMRNLIIERRKHFCE